MFDDVASRKGCKGLIQIDFLSSRRAAALMGYENEVKISNSSFYRNSCLLLNARRLCALSNIQFNSRL